MCTGVEKNDPAGGFLPDMGFLFRVIRGKNKPNRGVLFKKIGFLENQKDQLATSSADHFVSGALVIFPVAQARECASKIREEKMVLSPAPCLRHPPILRTSKWRERLTRSLDLPFEQTN
jgi:hypothetical protein